MSFSLAFIRLYKIPILLIIFSSVFYYSFAYDLDRTDYIKFLSLYTVLFFFFHLMMKYLKSDFLLLVLTAIGFRFIFLVATPNLSQDFYRFIWDGRMILEGLNPYISLPQTFIESQQYPIDQAVELYKGMGTLNGSHFTNYPPLNQLSFLLAALFSKANILGAIIVLRFQIILADIGIIYFGKKILERLNLSSHYIFLYALNPFIIIELTGNLHFEAVMLFFLIWSLYLLLQKKWVWAAIILGLSVSVKLIPLLFLPLFIQYFIKQSKSFVSGTLKWGGFCLIVVLTNIILFLPFLSPELISNYSNSVGLWFQKFEFNASLYYIAREIGYMFRGYNEIAIIGKIMPSIAIIFLAIITFFRKNKDAKQLITALLLGLTCYYFTTTTMHPWYLATLVVLSVFTKYRFVLVWSFVIVLSYQAYANEPWKEHLWLVGLEYLVVYGVLLYEIIKLNAFSSTKQL